jgi:hypothetical protein
MTLQGLYFEVTLCPVLDTAAWKRCNSHGTGVCFDACLNYATGDMDSQKKESKVVNHNENCVGACSLLLTVSSAVLLFVAFVLLLTAMIIFGVEVYAASDVTCSQDYQCSYCGVHHDKCFGIITTGTSCLFTLLGQVLLACCW